MVIDAREGRLVLGAQCAFRATEIHTGEPALSNLHDESWRDAARESLARLRGFGPTTVHLSHDPTIVHVP